MLDSCVFVFFWSSFNATKERVLKKEEATLDSYVVLFAFVFVCLFVCLLLSFFLSVFLSFFLSFFFHIFLFLPFFLCFSVSASVLLVVWRGFPSTLYKNEGTPDCLLSLQGRVAIGTWPISAEPAGKELLSEMQKSEVRGIFLGGQKGEIMWRKSENRTTVEHP